MQLRVRHTRIVATLGPASGDREGIAALIDAGMDVARLNASHADAEFLESRIPLIRELAPESGREVGVLLDLRGPKIRVGEFPSSDGVMLEKGEELEIDTEIEVGNEKVLACTYPDLVKDVEAGEAILLDDGLIELRVEEILSATRLRAKVIYGGRLKAHKGINVPGKALSAPALSSWDLEILEVGVRLGVDFVALSFVRRPEDLRQLRAEIARLVAAGATNKDGTRGSETPPAIIAKIEKPQALDQLPDILEACDGIMVARGDLGVELAPEKVPSLQKELIHEANLYGLPVITATQMLESMIEHPRPTRAEASDVANAIFDGTDALMLSAETAVGKYPALAVRMMDRIAREAESSEFYHDAEVDPQHPRNFDPAARSMAWSARRVARETGVRLIVVYTLTGRTAHVLSKLRPGVPIVAMCPDEAICRQTTLLHGVVPLRNEFTQDIRSLLKNGDRLLLEKEFVREGESVVVLGGTMQIPGATNLLQLRRIEKA